MEPTGRIGCFCFKAPKELPQQKKEEQPIIAEDLKNAFSNLKNIQLTSLEQVEKDLNSRINRSH